MEAMTETSAVTMERDRSEDRRIYLRISTYEEPYWYVIEEKSPISPADNELPGCKSEKDTVRRLPFPEAGCSTNNLAVINSRVYLIGGDGHTDMHNPEDDESLGYRCLNLGSDREGVVEEWSTAGGISADNQYGGGVTVAHDGCVYSVGPTLYRLAPGDDKWVKMPPTPQGPNPELCGFLYWSSLLGITKEKLYVCRIGGGVDKDANVMLSFDLKSGKWDNDVLDVEFPGVWSPGVVLYEDRYLFSFGTRSPKRRPIPEEHEENPMRMTRVQVEEVRYREEEVPGIYVFDLKRCQWLPEPVQGLPNDGSVIPLACRPLLKTPDTLRFSPQLFQIRNDDHHLALLWDSVGAKRSTLFWCKFVLDVAPDTITDDAPAFYAHSLSRGTCPLDEKTGYMLNCAVGM